MTLAWPASALAEITISPAARGFDVDITEQTSSTALLDALAGATGAKVERYPAESPIGASHLRSASLERVLRQLLPEARFVVRFNADDTPAEIIFLSAEDGQADAGVDDGSDPSMAPDQDMPEDTDVPMQEEPDMDVPPQ